MKKIISMIAALAICLTLSACSGAPANKKHRFEGLKFADSTRDMLVRIPGFDNLEHMSDLVVVGEFIDDSKVCREEYEYESYFSKDILVNIVSSCPMKITKVLYGDAKVGDIVNVLQREGIWEDRFVSYSALTPMQKGDEWIFCLSRSTESDPCDGYWCTLDSYGRYPTKNAASNETMCFSDHPELGVYDPCDLNEKFYGELIEKYGAL